MTLDKHIIFCKHVYIHVHVHFVIFCVNWTSCQLFRFEAKIYHFYCISIGSASILWCQSNNSQNIDRSRRIWGTILFCPMVPFNNFVYLIVGVRAVNEENILYLTFFFNSKIKLTNSTQLYKFGFEIVWTFLLITSLLHAYI